MQLTPLLEWLRPWIIRGRANSLVAQYRAAFESRRDVLTDLARLCHARAETYVPGDPTATAFNEGRRAVWLHIQRMLNVAPDDLETWKEEMDERYDI